MAVTSYSNSYTITIDTKSNISLANPIPVYTANDTNLLYIKILQDGQAYDYSNADRYVINLKRPDGEVVTGSGTYDSTTNMIKYVFGQTEMELKGSLECTISLFLSDTRITTRPFKIKVLEDLEDGIASQSGYGVLQDLIIEVEQVKSDTEAAAQYATEQGNYAKSKAENFTHKGDYSPTIAYKNGNVVTYGGINYICIQDTTAGIDPLNGAYWTVVSPQATINDQTWTATEGQTVFTITNGNYVPNQSNIQVLVGGVPQVSGLGFTETNSTTITLSEGVPAGTIVFAKWFEGTMTITKGHKSSHEVGGQDQLDVSKLYNYKELVSDKFDSVTTQLADITTMKVSEESAPLGTELVDGTGWTLSAGWTGDFATGFVHAVGNTTPLIRSMIGSGTKFYQVEITVSSPSSTMASNSGFTVSIGNSVGFEMYEGNYTEHTYVRGIQSLGDGNLVITPQADFDGTITNVSVKEILSPIPPTFEIRNSLEINVLEMKPTSAENENVFVGKDNAIYNTSGKLNVGVGVRALRLNTSGFWNVAVGDETMMANTVGSRNVALGHIALKSNISGHRNVAIGSFALTGNTHGHNNIALGADTMQRNTTGKYNIALGLSALAESVTGESNIAIGKAALGLANGVNNSVAVGDATLASLVTSTMASVAIGHDALRNATASPNTAIGEEAGLSITTGIDNIAIGNQALKNNQTGERNIVIGNYSGGTGSTKRNLIIGGGSGTSLQTGGDYNIIIGHASGTNITTGDYNIILGYNVQSRNATDNYFMNIGNLLYGELQNKRVGINTQTPAAALHLPAGTATALTAPLKFTTGALMTTPEAGAVEYDGTNLYFTTSSGVRKTLAVV